jgi:hypothetical protein
VPDFSLAPACAETRAPSKLHSSFCVF